MEMTPQHDTNIPNGALEERLKVEREQVELQKENYVMVWLGCMP